MFEVNELRRGKAPPDSCERIFGCGESGGRRRPGAGPQRRAKEARQPAVDDGEPCENQRHAGQRHEGDALAEVSVPSSRAVIGTRKVTRRTLVAPAVARMRK